MSESGESPAVEGAQPAAALSAGGLLRQARQAQGLHIGALAAQLKVSQRKLEALESDQHDELQGIAFVRALAQAACRVLKVDAAPVLARLPQVEQRTLDRVSGGLNEPFREKGSHLDVWGLLKAARGLLAIVGALLLAASLLWLLPPGFSLRSLMGQGAPVTSVQDSGAEHDSVAVDAATRSQPVALVTPTAASAPAAAPPVATSPKVMPVAVAGAASEPAPAMAPVLTTGTLALSAAGASWVEVSDGRGVILLARTLTSGESVTLDPALPVRLKIGNAAATKLNFRGKAVDLTSVTRDNVARLELK